MILPANYESATGAVLERLRAAVRRNPSGVDVRAVEPVRIQVVLVPVIRSSVPRSYGPPLESETFAAAPVDANQLAFARVLEWAANVRVRSGRFAVLARRIGGQP